MPIDPAQEWEKSYKEKIKELNNWKIKFSGKTPEEVLNEISSGNNDKAKLEEWERLFSTKEPSKVLREMKKVEAQRDARPNITLDEWKNDYSQRPTQEQVNEISKGLRVPEEDKKAVKGYLDKYKNTLERSVQSFEELRKVDPVKARVYNAEQKDLEAEVEQVNNLTRKVDNWGKK